jgi:hypothetical protein
MSITSTGVSKLPGASKADNDDLLDGAAAIAKYLTSLGLKLKPGAVYFHVSQHRLPVTRLGSRIIGSKSRLQAHFTVDGPKTGASK